MEQKHTTKGHHHEPGHLAVHGVVVKGGEKHSLYRYLILFCLFGSVLPFIAINTITYIITKGVIKQKAFSHLISIRDIKRIEMEDFFFERRADAFQLSSNNVFKSAATSYIDAFHKGGLRGAAYEEIDRTYGDILVSFAEAYQYYDVLVIDMDGDIVASARDRPELGKNVLKEPYSGTQLEEAFIRGKTGIDILDMGWYEPNNRPALFVSAPIAEDLTDRTVAVVVFHMENRKINDIMTQRSGLRETGETYLVGEDFLMRSDSRFIEAPSVLKMKVDTRAAREALAGNTDMGIIRNYRNVKVLSAFTPLDVSYDVRWALLVEMDKDEALTMESSVKQQFLYIGASLVLLWTVIILVFHRMMVGKVLT
ncbi:MAG: cache domain-containing protein [Candidatus Brocadiales bacterium]